MERAKLFGLGVLLMNCILKFLKYFRRKLPLLLVDFSGSSTCMVFGELATNFMGLTVFIEEVLYFNANYAFTGTRVSGTFFF